MSRSRRETKSRDRSCPKRIERTGSEYRGDPRGRSSRRKFGDLDINFIEILNKRSEAIRKDFQMIRVGRVKAKYTIFGRKGKEKVPEMEKRRGR